MNIKTLSESEVIDNILNESARNKVFDLVENDTSISQTPENLQMLFKAKRQEIKERLEACN